jgi:ribosome-associated protein
MNLEPELYFKTSRSGGKGGQNVNKVSSKVELNFDVQNSLLLNPEQKYKISTFLRNRITKEGILQITVQSSRSQFENKALAIEKLNDLIHQCFLPKKKRFKTKPKKSAKEKRLKSKKIHSLTKSLRRRDY